MQKRFSLITDFLPLENRGKIVTLVADNSGNFPEYGIIEGSFVFVDTNVESQGNKLYCLIRNYARIKNPHYKLSKEKELHGYSYYGTVVAVLNKLKEY